MLIFPAIDLSGGKAVRLTQGDYDRKTVYADDPAAVAKSFIEAGATCLHMVDLDGAKTGSPVNSDAIRAVCAVPGLFTELGGGIRSMEQIERYLSFGIDRVILGTAAFRDPDLLLEALHTYAEKIAVGVDAKNGFVALSGWLELTEQKGVDFCKVLRDMGVRTVIYTDISRDGALSGSNLELYRELSEISGLNVVASGGVSFEKEITALRDMGLYAAIVGKAIYEGKLSLPRVLALAKGEAV
ncbi:MAG: 1-(5-phosphoribosyl)-5-[(5-phosphoribosylamino)methylideneamino]imidazole-4-carboxamide isomerase [Eubacteriales bacterium]|nr:1-(5-phosphoribosyl)-5-[(5-phosphoribosylamino)methylideneamino]imidazole-4-carboxamide isomerase [Eubacteriales bacterium]